ncbi:MAG: hypothetical protein ACFE85_17945 [Candidatus Hodarchaeota archaeon]
MPEKRSLVDNIPLLDKNKAMKFIVYGLMVAILFGLMMMISRSVAQNADEWQDLALFENEMNYQRAVYGYTDYQERIDQIQRIYNWMVFQDAIFMNIARVGVNIALVFILIGFLSFAVSESYDERTRRIFLVIAGLILFLIMFTTFFAAIQVTVV